MSAASLSQVNGVNVIKLGHKQVVSLIRQGGNRLLMKVVTVTRKPETEEVIRRKGKVLDQIKSSDMKHVLLCLMLTY